MAKKKGRLDFINMKKNGEQVTWVTAYDFPMASFAEAAERVITGTTLRWEGSATDAREDWRNVQATAETKRASGDLKAAAAEVQAFHDKLCETRVLDPACGTGNFLYVSLELMKRLEGEVLEALQELARLAVMTETGHRSRLMLDIAGHSERRRKVLQALAARGWPALIAAERLQPPALFDWMCRLRGTHGHRFAPSDALLTPVVRRLRQGGLVGLMMDRDTTGSGRTVMVCGAAARLPVGALRLSVRLGVPIVPLHAQRRRNGSVQLTIHEPLAFVSTLAAEETLTNGLTALAAQLERLITWQPDQWVLTTPLWETSAADASCSSHHTTSPYRAASPST